MPLWYNTDSGWKPNKSFAGQSLDMDVYLCCGGPSLKAVKQEDVRVPGAFIACMNNSYKQIYPDLWVGMDDPHCYHRQIFWEPFIKVLRGGYQGRLCEGKRIDKNYNMFYADCKKISSEDLIFERSDDTIFIWKKNVMAAMLHILIWMGAKKIYLLGCDLSNSGGDYHDENVVLSKGNKKWNAATYKQINKWLQRITPKAKKHGIEIKSCTPNSPINKYMEYVPLDIATQKTQEGIPTGGKLFHSSDAERKKAGRKPVK